MYMYTGVMNHVTFVQACRSKNQMTCRCVFICYHRTQEARFVLVDIGPKMGFFGKQFCLYIRIHGLTFNYSTFINVTFVYCKIILKLQICYYCMAKPE